MAWEEKCHQLKKALRNNEIFISFHQLIKTDILNQNILLFQLHNESKKFFKSNWLQFLVLLFDRLLEFCLRERGRRSRRKKETKMISYIAHINTFHRSTGFRDFKVYTGLRRWGRRPWVVSGTTWFPLWFLLRVLSWPHVLHQTPGSPEEFVENPRIY